MSRGLKESLGSFGIGSSASLANLGISFAVLAVAPKVLGPIEFSLWQLYFFYCGLTVALHLGWVDGAYLRIGGGSLKELDRPSIAGSMVGLVFLQILFFVVFAVVLRAAELESEKALIFICVLLSAMVTNIRGFFGSILLACNQVAVFSIILLAGQAVFFVTVLGFIVLGELRLETIIAADIVGKSVSLAVALRAVRPLAEQRVDFKPGIWLADIKSGSKVLGGYLIGIAGIAATRLSIERVWGLLAFGQVSLMLAIVRLFTTFTQVGSYVLFPALRGMGTHGRTSTFAHTRVLVSMVQTLLFLVYFPAALLIAWWLPAYADALVYLALLFPAAVFEFRTTFLLITFLKALRLENVLLFANIVASGAGIVIILPLAIAENSILFAVGGISLIQVARSVFMERSLSAHMSLPVSRGIVRDASVALFFVWAALELDVWIAVLWMLVALVVRILLDWRAFIAASRWLRRGWSVT